MLFRKKRPSAVGNIDTLTPNDIAEVQPQEALLQTGTLQRAIFASANFAIIATDEKGVIQLFNVGAERMLGYSAAEVVNKINPSDIHDPQEVLARAQALSLELATPITPGFEALAFKASRGIEDSYELTYIRKDGSRFPGAVSITALRDNYDEIIGYLLIGADNAARKQAHEARETSEAKLSGLVASMLDAIVTIDANHCIVLCNPAAENMFGLTAAEMLGSNLDRLIPSRFRSAHSDRIYRYGETTSSARSMGNSREIFGLHADGSEFPIEASISQLETNGEQTFTVVLRDITERKRLDKALQEKNVELVRAKSAADIANLAKSDFLSSMSHELRSPLNAILGFAQLLELGTTPQTATQKESTSQILKAGWYLLDLINEILDLALIESGKLLLSLEPMSLDDVLVDCHAMVEPQALKHGITVGFCRFEKTRFIRADRTRVKQILINILSNAIKYNHAGGTVAVECDVISPERTRTRISVKDTGAGLSPEKLARLFQPFNRLGQESGSEEGTGIGLVMTKRLVELMDGIIGVESTVGVGSVFWVELIRAADPQLAVDVCARAALKPAHVRHDAALCTVLYVEDNPANLQLVEQLIARRPNIRLLSAGDATLGIELAREQQPEAILMDINLPGISGIKALQILREDPLTQHIPVVAVSANAMPRDIERGIEAGFFRYLTKPIKVNEFMETLDMALEFTRTAVPIIIIQ